MARNNKKIERLKAELEEAYFEKTKEQQKEIRAREKMEVAAAAFIKAKEGNDPKVYAKTKAELHKTRAAWREARAATWSGGVGTTVNPATLNAKASVNK